MEQSKKVKILVVDDNPSIHEDFSKIFLGDELDLAPYTEEPDFLKENVVEQTVEAFPKLTIDFAFQGEEAVEKVKLQAEKGESYSMAFVDIRMPPGIDGIETLDQIWKIEPALHAVVCSAYSNYSWEAILQRLNPSDQLLILRKPFDPMEVKQIFFMLLNKSKTLQKLRETTAELENTVKIQRAEMIESARLCQLGEMAGGIAHEINNPLTVIAIQARQLAGEIEREAGENEGTKRRVEVIKTASERIAKIVKSLLSFAREAEGEDASLVSSSELVEYVATYFSEKLKRKEIGFEVVAPEDLQIYCRKTQVSQVLVSLLNNAFDAVQVVDSKWIKVVVSNNVANGSVNISVQDSGGGISTDIADKIMRPFFTTKPVGQGTGLGLSISLGLIEDQGGTLLLDTEQEHTTFVISLPIPKENRDVA